MLIMYNVEKGGDGEASPRFLLALLTLLAFYEITV